MELQVWGEREVGLLMFLLRRQKPLGVPSLLLLLLLLRWLVAFDPVLGLLFWLPNWLQHQRPFPSLLGLLVLEAGPSNGRLREGQWAQQVPVQMLLLLLPGVKCGHRRR